MHCYNPLVLTSSTSFNAGDISNSIHTLFLTGPPMVVTKNSFTKNSFTKNSFSTPVIPFVLLLGEISGHAYSAVHPYCSNFSASSEHRITCESYDSSQVVVLEAGQDLKDSTDSLQAGQLLIVPPQSYQLSSPIKLKDGAGIMSGAEGLDGFLTLDWAIGFSIGNDPVYCLISLGEGSRLTGINIDASRLTVSNARYFIEKGDLSRTLVYSTGSSGFTISWSSFTGRTGMDAPLLIKNADNRTIVTGGTNHTIRRTWIETNGSTHGILLDTARVGNPANKENVDLTHLAIKLSNFPQSQVHQGGIHINNGCGNVRQNYFIFDDSPLYDDQSRIGLSLENVDGTQVIGNIFYSQEKHRQLNDAAFGFFESAGVTLNTSIYGNALSDRLSVGSPTNTATGTGIDTESVFRQVGVPFFLTREDFFRNFMQEIPPSLSDTTASSVAMPRAGACVAPMYALQNLTATEEVTDGDEDLWHHLCGLEVERSEYNLPLVFTPASCPDKEEEQKDDHSVWIVATATGWSGFMILALVDIALLGYHYVYKPFKAAKAASDTEVLVND